MELKERLADLRRERELSQEELAREIGVTRQAVSKWERGVIAPSTTNLIALGELYGVHLDELVHGEAPIREKAEEVKAAEPPADAPPAKPSPLKLAAAGVMAALVLLTAIASFVTLYYVISIKQEEPEDKIVWQNDLRVEDIDLSEVIDGTDGTEVVESSDGTTTTYFNVTLEP